MFVKISHSLRLLILFLSFTLAYYTYYEVHRALVEYKCWHKRPMHNTYNDHALLDSFEVSSTLQGLARTDNSFQLISLSNRLQLLEISKEGVSKVVNDDLSDWSKDFYFNKGYYQIKCKPSWDNITDFVISDSKKLVYGNSLLTGFLDKNSVLNIKRLENIQVNTRENVQPMRIKVTLFRSLETCAILQSTNDMFTLIYYLLSGAYFMLSILSCMGFKDFMFLRALRSVEKFFNDMALSGGFEFCNPMTGDPVNVKKGEPIQVLTDQKIPIVGIKSMPKLKRLKDNNGEYEISKDFLIYKNHKNKIKVFKLDNEAKNKISVYFFQIIADSGMCVVNNKQTHFLKTIDVLESLIAGSTILKTVKKESGRILDIHEFELNAVTAMTLNLNKATIKKLLEHNWRFFSNKYNISALTSCIRNRMWSSNRPDSVGNSQWKRYINDYCHILKSCGHTTKYKTCEKVTQAFKDLEHIDWGKIEVIKVPEKVNVVVETPLPEIKMPLHNSFERHLKLDSSYHNPLKMSSKDASNDPNYKKALDKFNGIDSEYCKKMGSLEAPKKLKDYRKIADEIKEAIFTYNQKLQEVEEQLKDPKLVIPDKHIKKYQKIARNANKGEASYYKELYTCEAPSSSFEMQRVLRKRKVEMVSKINWVKSASNYYSILEDLDDEITKYNDTSPQTIKTTVEIDFRTEVLKNKVLKEMKDFHAPSIKRAMGRRLSRYSKKNSKVNPVLSSGKCLYSKYISDNFQDNVKVLETREPVPNARPRTIYSIVNRLKKKCIKSRADVEYKQAKDIEEKIQETFNNFDKSCKEAASTDLNGEELDEELRNFAECDSITKLANYSFPKAA